MERGQSTPMSGRLLQRIPHRPRTRTPCGLGSPGASQAGVNPVSVLVGGTPNSASGCKSLLVSTQNSHSNSKFRRKIQTQKDGRKSKSASSNTLFRTLFKLQATNLFPGGRRKTKEKKKRIKIFLFRFRNEKDEKGQENQVDRRKLLNLV